MENTQVRLLLVHLDSMGQSGASTVVARSWIQDLLICCKRLLTSPFLAFARVLTVL